jgi:heme a synthase
MDSRGRSEVATTAIDAAARQWTVRPATVTLAHLVTVVFISVLIVTGAGVRLTGSGLGCSDWPECSPGGFIEAKNINQAIEQINRLITGLIAVPIVVGIVLSWLRSPRRRDLVLLSGSLFLWLVLEAVLGAIVVWTHLNPAVVAAHFLLGIAGLVTAVVLHRRSHEHGGPSVAAVGPVSLRLVRAAIASGVLAFALGTVVTGSGPHSGDEDAVDRFPFLLTSAARVHSLAVWLTVAFVLALVWSLRRSADRSVLQGPVEAFLMAAFVQGSIGYVQFATKLPAGLVIAHIAGSVAVAITLARLHLATRTLTLDSMPTPMTPEP